MAEKIIQKILPRSLRRTMAATCAGAGRRRHLLGTALTDSASCASSSNMELKDKMAVIGGMTGSTNPCAATAATMRWEFLTTAWYSRDRNPLNKAFAPAFGKQFKYDPGFYAPAPTVAGAVLSGA